MLMFHLIDKTLLSRATTRICKLKMKGTGAVAGSASIDQIKAAFYHLARSNKVELDSDELIYSQPDVLSQSTPPVAPPPELLPLSSEERDSALVKIKAAGEAGITIGDTGMSFVWKEKCGVGFQQPKERASDQLCIMQSRTNSFDYNSICTHNGTFNYLVLLFCIYPYCYFADCFSTTGTRADEVMPKCLMHKGPNESYAVYEFKAHKGGVTGIGHMIMKFNYAKDKKQSHLQQAFSKRSSIKPKGVPGKPELFNTCDEAEKRLAVLQTVALLKCFSNPNKFKYTTPSVSLANGLEAEVKNEMEEQRFKLELTGISNSKTENAQIPFPFGRRATPDETLVDLLDDEHGALYIVCDNKMFYGGQTISGVDTHNVVRHGSDTVAQYEKEYGTGNVVKIPLCAIPIQKKKKKKEDKATTAKEPAAIVEKDDLKKMEAHLHVGLYIAYLFRLRNPFHPTFTKTHPYCLNKQVFSSYFDEHSWEKVVLFLRREFGCQFEFKQM
ncbi:uncharacterized protein LOC110848003 isoform X1 [Folsomia candida]|uniref:uncharacterized protein LOC110848003 isoform X1 n=1 Tax=Folsomia candida TaxID=158441 RepID=UPI0016054C68|nr:uncharacterized protein LOC110848003 isoform X1 [Folsomia candida]